MRWFSSLQNAPTTARIVSTAHAFEVGTLGSVVSVRINKIGGRLGIKTLGGTDEITGAAFINEIEPDRLLLLMVMRLN